MVSRTARFSEFVRAFLLFLVPAMTAQSQTFKLLYTFTGGADGLQPDGTLLLKNGILYGTTYGGGASGQGRFLSLILQPGLHGDSAGNLYGTTYRGGNVNAGLVFELDTGGNLTMLHSFMGSDGGYPTANLIADSVGNLYSTTTTDGNSNCGTVFKLATLGQTSPTLHSFSCQPDGSTPKAGLLPATRTGNLYGTTSGGGTSNFGTVFEVNANTGMEAVLYSFTGGADGATPVGGLITDQAGNLYGTTTAGGNVTMALVTESCSS